MVLLFYRSGAEFSGVVCVLINELNKMKKDGGVLNVLQSVKTMKSRNRDIIPTYVSDTVSTDSLKCIFKS